MDEERQRKLEAGKEKFAELMKKKNVRDSGNERKKKRVKRTSIPQDETTVSNNMSFATQISESATYTLDKITVSHVLSTKEISQHVMSFDLSEAEHVPTSEPSGQSLMELTQFELSDPGGHIFIENQNGAGIVEDGVLTITESEWKLKLDGYNKKLQEYKNSLQHRDEIIGQLSSSLQTSIEHRNQLQSDSHSQAEMMADEIEELKQQLHQATELLRSQKGKNGISAQELFDAKNEVTSLQNSQKQKDQALAGMVKQLSDKAKEWEDSKIDLVVQLQQLKADLAEAEHQRQNHQRNEQELSRLLEETKQQLRQQTTEFVQTHQTLVQEIQLKDGELNNVKDQLQEMKKKASDDVQQLMKTLERLQQEQPSLDTMNSQVEEGKAIVRAELDELYGLQITQMKSQMREEFQLQLEQLHTDLSQCRQERDYFKYELRKLHQANYSIQQVLQTQISETQMQTDCYVDELDNCESINQQSELNRQQHLNDSSAIDDRSSNTLNLNSDLQGVMREIIELKNENKRLKEIVIGNNEEDYVLEKMPELLQPQNKVVNMDANDFAFESGDHAGKLQTEMSLWKLQHDKVLKEKLELEMKLNCMLESSVANSSMCANKEHELSVRRIKMLEEELRVALEFRAKCEGLELEKISLNEKHMNHINSFEKRKLELELRVRELESRYEVLLKSKQAIETEWMEKRRTVTNSFLSAEQMETSDAQLLIEQVAASDNDVTVLTLRLQAQEELKCALNAKLEHLVKSCENYAWQQNQLKCEIETLQNQLQLSWQQHEDTLEELRNTKKNLSALVEQTQEQNKDRNGEIFDSDRKEEQQILPTIETEIRELKDKFDSQNRLQSEAVSQQCIRCEKLLQQLENHGISTEGSMCDGELLDLRQKMKLVMDSNRELLEEKETWLLKLNEQKQFLENLQVMTQSPQSNEEQDTFGWQLNALHEKQDELVNRLEEQNKNQVRYFDVLEERNILQEALRREKIVILQKIKEKEELESKLIHQKVEFERVQFERKHLEEVLLHKDQMEQELKRQRRSLEDDLAELEHLLKDREDLIRFDKAQLQMEMNRKDLVLRKWQSDLKEKQIEYDSLKLTMNAKQEERVANMHIHLQRQSLQRIEQLRDEMDNHHSIAIDRLKRDLINHFAVREGRLVESHLFEVSRLQDKHLQQMKILQPQPKGREIENSFLMTQLKQMNISDDCFQQSTVVENLCPAEIQQMVKKLTTAELQLLYQQINIEVACQQQRFAMVCQEGAKAAEVKAEHAKQMALADLRENLTKAHKDELNTVLQSFQTRVDLLQKDHNLQLASILGAEKLSSQALLDRLEIQMKEEFRQVVQNLTQEWGSEYLDRLANLKKEVEEKFREATSSRTCPEEKKEEEGEKKGTEKQQDGGQHFSQVETLLEEKEEILSKITELRKNVAEKQTTEMKIMKERLQTEFSTVIEIQTEMKKDLESGQSPLVIELKKVKEEYEKLQEKYEEITKEEITIEEEPLEDAGRGKKEVTVIHKITELPGATRVEFEKSYDQFVFEDAKVQQDTIILEEALRKLQKKLEEKHVKEMEDLRIYFEKRCEDMEKKYVDEVSRLKTSQTEEDDDDETGEDTEFVLPESNTHLTTLTHFCDTSHVLESSLEELEEHYKAELDHKLEEVRKQLETKYRSDLSLLTEEMEVRVQVESEKVRVELAEKYTRQIEDITQKHEEEVELLKNKYSDDLAKAITDVRLECSVDSAKEIEGESKKLAEEMKEGHERDLNNLRSELELKHLKEMEILQARFSAQKAEEINNAVMELRHNLQKEREQFLEKEIQKSPSAPNEEWRLRVEEELKANHQEQLEMVKSECQQKCNVMKEQLERIMMVKEDNDEIHATDRENLQSQVQLAIMGELDQIKQTQETNEESTGNDQMKARAELELHDDAHPDKLNLLESHQVELERSERENVLAISTLKEQFRDEISEVHSEYEKKINDLKNGWQKQLEGVQAKTHKLKSEHVKELDQMKAAYEKELSDEKIRWQEELTADHIVKFEAVTQELDSCHRLELEDMRHAILKDHEEAMEQLQHNLLMKEKEFQILTRELKENHEKDLEELGQQHKIHLAAEVKRVKIEMENVNEEKLQAIALDTDVLKSELEDVHRKEIIELQEKMSKKHQEEMEEEVKKVIGEMESLKEVLKCKLEEDHAKQLQLVRDELQLSCETQLQALREACVTEKQMEIKELRLNFEEQLAQAASRMINERSMIHLDERDFKEPEEEQLKVEITQEESLDKSELQPEDIVTRRLRENEENENLIVLLEQELKELRSENDNLNHKNKHMKEVLSEVIGSYAKVEMIINKQLLAIANSEDSEQSSPSKTVDSDERLVEPIAPETLDMSVMSFLSEDGFEMDLGQRITEASFSELDLDPENEQLVNAISNNLQLAVTRLLRLLTVTVHQCHESKLAQMELVNTATSHGEEAAIWSNKCSELEGQLVAEVQSKEHLAAELTKYTELLGNLKSEKKKLENELQKHEDEQHHLFAQLEQAQLRIQESEERMAEEKNHFDRQRTLISEGLDIHEQISAVKSDVSTENNLSGDQGILEENSQLHTNHSNLQRQSEKDKQQMTKRVHELETLIEEQMAQSEHQLDLKRQEIEDLHQQVDALEKQLRADKKFFDAQTAEYEQEREDFQREVNRLQNIIREKEKQLGSGDRLSHEGASSILTTVSTLGSRLESLSMQLQDKTQTEEEILRAKTLLEAELQKLGDKMSDWQEIVKNLEFQLDQKSNIEEDLTEQVQNLQTILSQTSQVNEELSSELEIMRSASNSNELSNHVQFLEDQLENRTCEVESFRNSENLMLELRGQIRNLEEKVEKKTRELEALQISASSMSSPSSEDLSLRDQLDAMRAMRVDDLARAASPCYFDDLRRLEEKLEALAKAEEAAIKKTRDLEMLLKKQKQVEEELLQDKEALQQQVNSQLLQISALQARIEEWRHNIDNTDATERISRLQENSDRDRELLEKREKEIDEMREQLEQLRIQLVAREDEISHLTLKHGRLQYETPRHKSHESESMNVLKTENDKLKSELRLLKEQFSSMSIPSFAQTLLDEKNEEIDHLTQQLDEMQASLEKFRSNQAGDATLSETEMIRGADQLKLSSLQKILHEKEEKLKRMEELLKAGQEELTSFQRVSAEKEGLNEVLQQKEAEMKRAHEVAEHRKREVESLRGVLKEKQALLEQVETLQGEITSLTEFQTKLQEDYDTVQSMLEDNQKDLLNIQQQLVEKDAALQLEQRRLQDQTVELKMAVEKKDKEICCLQDRLDLMAQNGALKQDELRREIINLRDKLAVDEDSIELLRRQPNVSDLSMQNMSISGDTNLQIDVSKDEIVLPEISPNLQKIQMSELDVRNKEVDRLKLEKSQLECRLSELLQNEVETKKRLKKTEAEVLNLRSSINNANFSDDIRKFQQQVQETNLQLQHYKQEFSKTAEELERAKDYHSALELELATIPKLKLQVQEKEHVVKEQQKEIEVLKSVQHKLENKIEKLEESKADMENLLPEEKDLTTMGDQSKELTDLRYKLSSAESDLETKEVELQSTNEELSSLQIAHSDMETKNLFQQSEIEKLKDDLEQYQENLETMQSVLELEKDRSRKAEDQYKQELHDVHKSYKMKIDSMRSEKRDGSHASQRKDSSSKQVPRFGIDSETEVLTESEIPSEMQTLMQKVHREGVQVLSLSELLFLRSFNQSATEDVSQMWNSDSWTLHRAWDNEKQQLLAEIVALKDLLTQATEATASLRTTGQATAELSNLLLQAVATVFQKERETMVAELRTHMLASKAAAPNEIDRLEQRIKEMDNNQQIVMSRVQQLLDDPESAKHQDMTKRLNKERLKHHKEREQFLKQISKLEEDISRRENHFKKQIELLEYRAKQEQMIAEDLRINLQLEKKHTLDLSSQLSCEKGINADLDTALTITRSELLKIQTMNNSDRREIQTLSAACESEKFRAQALLQALESEQNNFSQLQEAMEAEKRRCKSSTERHQQIIQELQRSLEMTKENHHKALSALEQERQNHTNTLKMLETVQNKRNIVTQEITTEMCSVDHNQNLDLSSALERERHRVATLCSTLAQERASAVEEMEREQSVSRRLTNKLDAVQEHNSELKRDLQREKERAAQLDMESAQLRSQLTLNREQDVQRQANWETKRLLEREQQRENELQHEHDRQKQRELELEVQKHIQGSKVMDKEIEHLRERANQLQNDLENEQRKQSRLQSKQPEHGILTKTQDNSSTNIQECHLIETAKQQLQCLVFKCQHDLDLIIKQLGVGDSIMQNVAGILKTFVVAVNEVETDVNIPADAGDQRLQQFLEQVLHQNAELVGFVIQLCEDKMELRRLQMKLEEELSQLRHKQVSANQALRRSAGTSEDILSAERMTWAQERASLQLALHKAESEVTQLRSALQLSAGSFSQESLALSSASGKMDDKLRRLHIKYLRSESFRKALVYQKKYLLILLGGFQESEAATLAMICQMGIPASSSVSTSVIRHPAQQVAFQRFRSAARVVIAICRMKYLVKRWRLQARIPSSGTHDGDHQSSHHTAGFEHQLHFLNGRTPSAPSPDDLHARIHRVGTTPPVKDYRGCFSSHSISERSGSSAKKSLVASLVASSDDPTNPNILLPLKSDKSLQKYLERMESIQQHFGVVSTSRLPVTTVEVSEPIEKTITSS